MATEICINIDDQGKLSVSVEPDVQEGQGAEGAESDSGAKKIPVKDIAAACQAVQQIYAEVMRGVEDGGGTQQQGEGQGSGGSSAVDAEAQAMQDGYKG